MRLNAHCQSLVVQTVCDRQSPYQKYPMRITDGATRDIRRECAEMRQIAQKCVKMRINALKSANALFTEKLRISGFHAFSLIFAH